MRQDLADSGFLENTEKSVWVPYQRGQHLGYIVDLQKGIFSVTPARIDKLFALLEHISKEKLVSARFIFKLIGSIISMSLGVGPVCRLRTRMLYREIQEAVSWDKKFSISMEAKEEVAFWYRCFHKYNGQPIWPSSPKISVLTYSDASSLAWGGYSVNFCGLTAKGNFSESEMNSSSTWRELSATFNVLRSFINLIEGKVIKHRTDCQNVVRVLNSGTKKFDLQNLVCDIFNLCIKHNIQLHSEWIPRNENWNADYISKDVDRDDYMLNPEIFAAADLRWGPHSIDRFSSFKTHQVPRFCSRWLNPLMEYLDAFTASWQNENNWLFPPPYLIPKVLKHLEFSKATGTLVAPMWTSAIWWPLLTYDGKLLDMKSSIILLWNQSRITSFQLLPGFLYLVVTLQTLLLCY